MAKPKYNSKELTNHLRTLAAEAHTIADDGTFVTKGEALADLLWQKALGYEEKTLDDEGNEKIVKHDPAAWAIQLVYDRMEGKTPQAVTEDDTRIKAAEAVREMAKNRINDLAAKHAPVKPGPPSLKKKKENE